MRPFTRLTTGLRQQSALLRTPAPRTFTTASPLRLKEDKAQDPQELEKAKQRQGHDGKAREELASSSESNVAADRQNVKDHDSHIEDLQKETAEQKEKERAKGQS